MAYKIQETSPMEYVRSTSKTDSPDQTDHDEFTPQTAETQELRRLAASAAAGDRKTIFLNAEETDVNDAPSEGKHIEVLGSTSGVDKGEQVAQTLKNGNVMSIRIDGSYI